MSSLLTSGVNSLESAFWSSPPLPEAFTSTQGLFPDFCMSHQLQTVLPVVQLLASAATVYSTKSPAVLLPQSSHLQQVPSQQNRLLCNPPGLQLSSNKQLRINLSQCILFRSFFWCESSWSTGTKCLWSRRLDKMTSRDPCQTLCFYQSENSRKCWLSPKLNFRHDSSDPTGVILYSISKLTKLLHRKYTSKKLVLLVRCWCIYSYTFIRKLLLYP